MHTDPSAPSTTSVEASPVPGPAVSRTTTTPSSPAQTSRELLPPFVSPAVSSGARAEEGPPAPAAVETQPEEDGKEPHDAESASDDLAWLAAIDWGDDHGKDEDPATPPAAESTLQEAQAGEPAGEGGLPIMEDPVAVEDPVDVMVEELTAPAEAGVPGESNEPVPSWLAWTTHEDSESEPSEDELPIVEIESLLEEAEAEPTDRETAAPAAEELSESEPLVFLAEPTESADSEPPAVIAAAPASLGTDEIDHEPADAGSTPDTPLAELATRLETIARALREGSLSDLVAGAGSSDPLEVLLAGYALGYARARSATSES